VVDEEGKQLGIMPPFEALKIARSSGLDLVEVAPTANPPVCRIINYGKYLYQLNKRQHEARKHQKSVGLKEVKFRPRTSTHDYEVKKNKILSFLEDGSKVKATIMFRGREMAHRDIGRQMMNRLIEEVSEVGQVETMPRQEGPTLTAIIAPKKAAGKPAGKSSGASNKAGASGASKPAPRPMAGSATAASGRQESSGG
jgi:translation initiation factor IF-3